MPLGLDAGTYRWGAGWDLSWSIQHHHGLEVRMSDETSANYAHGHHHTNAVPVLHHIYRSPDGKTCQLHLTTESGLHYHFSFTREQAWSAARWLTEVISRMSVTGKRAP